MSTDEEDKGGIVLGGISFGTGGAEKPPAKAAEGQSGDASGADTGAGADDAQQELGDVLLPLRAVIVSDLTPRGAYNAGANPPPEPIAIRNGELDELFGRLAPRLAIEVESVLEDGKRVRVDLSPTSIKSFRPDALGREVPLLRSLLDGKRVLDRLREGTLDVDGAHSELARLWKGAPLVDRVLGGVEPTGTAKPAAAPSPAADDSDVDRLLDMVDTGDGGSSTPTATAPAPKPAKTGRGRFDAFLAMVAGSASRGRANPDEAIRTLERAFSVQLGAITQHPEVQRLEAAWRGLDFLLRRSPKTGATIEVVSCRPEESAVALERAISHRYGMAPPVTFAMVDTVTGGDAQSLAALRALAEVGEGHAVPIITNASAGLMGRDDLTEVDRLDNKQTLFDAPERVVWRKEAHRPAMLWVALCINPILARTAYDKRSSRIREATIEELPGDEASATIWMQPAWAVASLALQSFEQTGWPCRITGAREGGLVENLPVRELGTGNERVAIPTQVFFSTETQKALSRIGLVALAAQPNRDDVYLLSAPTAYVPPPKKTYDSDTTEPEVRYPQTPLVDQLFVARLAQFLRALGRRIGSHEKPDDIKQFLEAALWELFDGAKPGSMDLEVAVQEHEDGLGVQVTVRPRRFLGVGMEEITLGVPLGS